MGLDYLITGGAGFLGINLTRYLLERGNKVTSLDFAKFDYEDCKDEVRTVTGDIRDSAKVSEAIDGADIVVHCAAALPLYSEEEIFSIDVDGTRNILEHASRNGIQRVIHISSTAVYGIPNHHPIYEEDELMGVGPYGEAKIEAEKVCLGYRDRGMIIPILRPKSFIGPERLGVFAMLYEWASEGHGFPMIGDGSNQYQLLDVEDLCQAIHLAATADGKTANDTFNIGAEEFTTMKQDFQAVLDHAGYGKSIRPLPASPIILALKILESLSLSPLYQWIYETIDKDSFVSIEKAQEVLGFNPEYSNQDALIRNFEWYLENIEAIRDTTGISHRVPWKQGALGLARHLF